MSQMWSDTHLHGINKGVIELEPDIPAGLQNMPCNPAGISGSFLQMS